MHAGQEAEVSSAAGTGEGEVAALGPCAVWGVLNVTPDSFSDGGRYRDARKAVEHGLRMWHAGAEVVDVGGESTRPPGATYGRDVPAVGVEEELSRVLPVIEALVRQGVRVSVDTSKPAVARAALSAGAAIVNDVTTGRDPELLRALADAGPDRELVLMHNRGRGEREGPGARYDDVVREALDEVQRALDRAEEAGVSRARVWIDPGLGFAKAAADSLRLLGGIGHWVATGQRVLVGASRKSFLAHAWRGAGDKDGGPEGRLPASLVAACAAQAAGCAAVRVHDVPETLQALRVAAALGREGSG